MVNLHSPGMGLHVQTTAYFSSCFYCVDSCENTACMCAL